MTNEEAKDFLAVESCKRCRDYRNGGCYGLTACFMSKQRSVLALEKQIEAEKKPKRRIDTMTEEELRNYFDTTIRHCKHRFDGCAKSVSCSECIAHYLLSPAESEEKK